MQIGQPHPMMAPGFSGSFTSSPHMMAPQPFMQTQFQPPFGQPVVMSPTHGHPFSPVAMGGPMMMPHGGPPLAIPPSMQFAGPPMVSSPQSPGGASLPMQGVPTSATPPLQPFSQSAEEKKIAPMQLNAPVRSAPPPPQRDAPPPSQGDLYQNMLHDSQDSSLQMDKALHHSYSSLPDTYVSKIVSA